MKTLAQVFAHTLKDVYYAENALAKALPKVAQAVESPVLRRAIEQHLEETRHQVELLKQVFEIIGQPAEGEKCDAMDGLIAEAQGIIDEGEGAARDAALIGAAQAVEHYEIARYGTLREWAKALGEDEAHDILGEILDQEKAANAKLTTIAVTEVNAGNGRQAA